MFIFEREREREREFEWGRGGGWAEDLKQLCADCRKPDAGLALMNGDIMTWAEVGPLTD